MTYNYDDVLNMHMFMQFFLHFSLSNEVLKIEHLFFSNFFSYRIYIQGDSK